MSVSETYSNYQTQENRYLYLDKTKFYYAKVSPLIESPWAPGSTYEYKSLTTNTTTGEVLLNVLPDSTWVIYENITGDATDPIAAISKPDPTHVPKGMYWHSDSNGDVNLPLKNGGAFYAKEMPLTFDPWSTGFFSFGNSDAAGNYKWTPPNPGATYAVFKGLSLTASDPIIGYVFGSNRKIDEDLASIDSAVNGIDATCTSILSLCGSITGQCTNIEEDTQSIQTDLGTLSTDIGVVDGKIDVVDANVDTCLTLNTQAITDHSNIINKVDGVQSTCNTIDATTGAINDEVNKIPRSATAQTAGAAASLTMTAFVDKDNVSIRVN